MKFSNLSHLSLSSSLLHLLSKTFSHQKSSASSFQDGLWLLKYEVIWEHIDILIVVVVRRLSRRWKVKTLLAGPSPTSPMKAKITMFPIFNTDLTFSSIITHSVVLDTLQITAIALVISFTPASFIIHSAILPLILAIPMYSISGCFERVQRTIWGGILGSHSSGYLLQYLEVALLGRYAFEGLGPASPDQNVRLAK